MISKNTLTEHCPYHEHQSCYRWLLLLNWFQACAIYLRMFQFLHNPFHSCCLLLLGQSGRKIKFSSLLYTLGKHDHVFRNFYCVGTNHMRDQSKKTTAFTVNKQPWVTSIWQFELQFSSFIDVVKVTLTHQNSAVSPTAVQSNLTWVKKFKKRKELWFCFLQFLRSEC